MKGFIVSLIIVAVVIAFVFTSSLLFNARINEICDEVDGGRKEEAERLYQRTLPFLHLCAPDELLIDVDVAFADFVAGSGEAEKDRLILLLGSLRRQVGLHPISMF